jgi:hypothetical protein
MALVESPEFDYCTNYHCAGDCGYPHNDKERAAYIKHALAVLDDLGKEKKEKRRLDKENVRLKA